MIRVWHWFLHQYALQVILLIVLMAYVATLVPMQWRGYIRLFNGWAILVLLLWGFFQFGKQARVYRDELYRHRQEILTIMREREADLVAIRQNAEQLAIETAAIAAALATRADARSDATSEQIEKLGKQMSVEIHEGTQHAERAYHEANSVNEKIEQLNKRLIERSDAIKEVKDDVHEAASILKEGLLPRAEQLDIIEKTTSETHQIVKDSMAKDAK